MIPRDDEVYDWAGLTVQELVRAEYDFEDALLLDVGAGQGKYARLLPEFTMDACEAWIPTVEQWQLKKIYRRVFVGDVYDLVHAEAVHDLERGDTWSELGYDLVIMGDVLEHLNAARGQSVVQRVARYCDVVVVVPYRYHQGVEHGNPFQCHLQPDLTPEVMTYRYPQLELVALETRERRAFKGIYRRTQGDVL